MPDSRPDGERDLERELRDLGSHLEYPPTPNLARAARRRIEEQDEERAARRGRFWLPALSPRWAVAAMFVVVLAVPALSPSARESLSSLFVVGGGASSGAGGGAAQSAGDAGDAAGKSEPRDMAAGEPEARQAPVGDAMPESASGGQAESGSSAPKSGGDGQAESSASGSAEAAIEAGAVRITLREARERAGEEHPVLLPREPAVNRPETVYELWTPQGNGLALVYQIRPGLPSPGDTGIGLVLTQAPGDIRSTFLRDITEKKPVEEVNVGNRRGYWITEAHPDPVVWEQYASGEIKRLRVNVLLWEQDGLSLRLESKLTGEEAIRIAESVR